MAYIEAKARHNRTYYYLTHNRRMGNRWKKTRRYIGASSPSIPAQAASPMASAYRTALPKIRALSKNPKISAVYLFGSFAKGLPSPHDIDICVIGKGMTLFEMGGIASRFDSPIDLSFMENMPHYVAINVLKEGRPVFISNRKEFSRKWLKVVREHLDSQPMRERVYSGVERWMSSQTQPTA